jgi:ferrochelatase
MKNNEKISVVLLNLGGPLSLDGVQNFLFNLFYDKAIINLPNPFRYIIAKLISSRRTKKAQGIYEQLGGKSPLLEETKAQTESLEKLLKSRGYENTKVHIVMRYASPRASEVVEDIAREAGKIIIIPLYPQFSATTTGSSVEELQRELGRINTTANIRTICCYPTEHKFIASYVDIIKEKYQEAEKVGKPRILFSAHGLPKKNIKQGDSYEWQVTETVKNIVMELGVSDLDWVICYQSKVGPMEWLKPSTEEEIVRACSDEVPILIVPVAFVSEHSETLVELDIEYLHLAKEHGTVGYFRAKTVGVHKLFVESLADMTDRAINYNSPNKSEVISHIDSRLCPQEFCKCINMK